MITIKDITRIVGDEIDALDLDQRFDMKAEPADWHNKLHQSAQLPITLPHNHPFKISVGYSDDSSSATITIYVLAGGFIWRDADGAMQFAGTDGSTAQEGYNIESVNSTTFAAGDEVWATLDLTSGAPEAALATAALAAGDGKYSMLVGKVNAAGGIEQFIHDHIFIGLGLGTSGLQLDHSFLPEQLTDTAASVSPGFVTYRNGTRDLVEPTDINFAVNKCFWLVVSYSSAAYSVSNTLSSGLVFPVYCDFANKRLNVPLFSFLDNTFESLKRHLVGDYVVPQIADNDTGGALKTIERSPAADDGRDAMQIRNATAASDHKAPYLRSNDIAWDYPVQGPGTAPGAISSGTVVTSVSSTAGSANPKVSLSVKTRPHTVANGTETWGTESEASSVSADVLWTGGTLYQVWQKTIGGYGFDWTRAH